MAKVRVFARKMTRAKGRLLGVCRNQILFALTFVGPSSRKKNGQEHWTIETVRRCANAKGIAPRRRLTANDTILEGQS